MDSQGIGSKNFGRSYLFMVFGFAFFLGSVFAVLVQWLAPAKRFSGRRDIWRERLDEFLFGKSEVDLGLGSFGATFEQVLKQSEDDDDDDESYRLSDNDNSMAWLND